MVTKILSFTLACHYRMGICLFALLLAIVSTAQAQLQPTLRVGANTQLVGTGAVRLVYGGGAITNNGSLNLAAGQFSVAGPTTYSGTGTATVATTVFNHTGNSTLNSLLSVTGRATLTIGTALNANGQLYLRTDQFAGADMVNNGVLTGTVQGLLTRASATSGTAPYNSQLSVNMSGSSMAYQWQSSANGTTFADVPGAIASTYTATVAAPVYYRCRLMTNNSSYDQLTPAVQLAAMTVITTQPTISSFGSANAVEPGACQTQLTATGCGRIFIFTNTAGFVYSVVYRVRGCYAVSAPAVMKPGTYTLTVYDDGGTPVSSTTTVSGPGCP